MGLLRKPSLRRKLLLHLLWPLCLTWALGFALVMGLAYYFVMQAYDRSLLDDAYALSAQVQSDAKGGPSLSLTDAEMSAVLFDQTETNYFSIWGHSGGLIAGHAALRPAAQAEGFAPVWSDGSYSGRAVRAVTLPRYKLGGYVVVVAQTTDSRSRMIQQLLLAGLAPQVLLLLVLAWWLRRQVRVDLAPLLDLQKAVEGRDAADLQHVPSLLAEQARTADIARLGLAMNSLFDRLQSSIQAQREFSGNVAHELRTPLAGIRLQAEHALTLSDVPLVRERMSKLLQGVDHASHLVDQLLALAFADEAEYAVSLVEIDLTEVARAAVLRHLVRADALGVDFGADGLDVPGGVFVFGHRVLLDATLDNLIDNAFRYGLGGVEKKVTVSVSLLAGESRRALLAVQDDGAGMGEQDAAFYKNRWTQAHDSQQLARRGGAPSFGVGLGLAIVARYAELLCATFALAPTRRQGDRPIGLCASLGFAVQS